MSHLMETIHPHLPLFQLPNFQIMSPPSDLVPEALQEAEMMNIYHTQKISFDYFRSLRHLGVVCFDPTLT